MNNINHHNFIAHPGQTQYLIEVASDRFGGSIGRVKSEVFRLIIDEHKNGQCMSDKAFTLLKRISEHYNINEQMFMEKLFAFIDKHKPNINILEK